MNLVDLAHFKMSQFSNLSLNINKKLKSKNAQVTFKHS